MWDQETYQGLLEHLHNQRITDPRLRAIIFSEKLRLLFDLITPLLEGEESPQQECLNLIRSETEFLQEYLIASSPPPPQIGGNRKRRRT